MTTLDAMSHSVPGGHPDHEHDHAHAHDGSDCGENDAVRHWPKARLREAPTLTSEQLQRLRLLLGVEQAGGIKAA